MFSSTPPCRLPEPSSPISPISPLALTIAFDKDLTSPPLEPIIEHVQAEHRTQHTHRHRAGSAPMISFKQRDPQSPLGPPKPSPVTRARTASPPPPSRFQHHVSFDNFAIEEPTKRNTVSLTLNVKHQGYQYKRRSRTFMVGIDENDYSDIAVQWLLEELVDDGDEIICLRVIDKDSKMLSERKKQYQAEAEALMKSIQKKNDYNRAISIVLEFSVGKVHTTFQKMIQVYEPAMLIVGTRGRSLGGFQGLVTNRNSFSKWCLQYSPIPVVVIRPTEKRMKKKMKRDADPARQDYQRILRESGIDTHETEITPNNDLVEASESPDKEAHYVAAALGLPARFDPTISASWAVRRGKKSGNSEASSSNQPPVVRPSTPDPIVNTLNSASLESPANSIEEESSDDDDDEEEGEFEAINAAMLLDNGKEPELEKMKKLHEMEVGEAAAFAAAKHAADKKMSFSSLSSTGSTQGGVSVVEDNESEKANE